MLKNRFLLLNKRYCLYIILFSVRTAGGLYFRGGNMSTKKKTEKRSGALSYLIQSLVAIALYIYAMYSFYYEFLRNTGSLNTKLNALLAAACMGFIASLYAGVGKRNKKGSVPKRILAFAVVTALFAALILGIGAFLNFNAAADIDAVNIVLFAAFVATGIFLLICFIRFAGSGLKAVNVLLAVVCAAVSIGTGVNCVKKSTDAVFISLMSKSELTFASLNNKDVEVTRRENMNVRDWYEENVLVTDFTDKKPVFDFKVGSQRFSENWEKWDIKLSKESKVGKYYKGGKTSFITMTDENGIKATVTATIYEDSSTCEWTVFIKNTAEGNSPNIGDFYAADVVYDTGDAELYYARGSYSSNDDFTLLKMPIPSKEVNFFPYEGRSSDKYLPYFNFCGKRGSFVLGIGWTGEWNLSTEKDGNNTCLKVSQKEFDAYLEPGEQVRSPLVSLSFYSNNNALKGFNAFRNWLLADVIPKNARNIQSYVIADEFSTASTDELIEKINAVSDKDFKKINTCWMDAGWYTYTESWYDGNGSWTPDPNRFPEGLKPLADAINKRGAKFLLWYEPERLKKDTELYNAGSGNVGWIHEDDGNIMWNLANDEACDYLAEYISDSLKENGVSVYRQDFNFEPLEYWHFFDKNVYSGRTGICENHYVTNLYRYLDTLRKNVPGLVIDNCASGGRRLDLEMMRRSVPLWRSDYNCSRPDDIIEATQSMSYGISFWLPVSGTVFYPDTEYSARSSLYPCYSFDINSQFVGEYNAQRSYLYKNYYPLADGGLETDKILAMQFGDDTAGEALIYKRRDCKDDSFVFMPNGLSDNKMYDLYDIDDPDNVYSALGSDLMKNGMRFDLPEGEKAVIIMYKVR